MSVSTVSSKTPEEILRLALVEFLRGKGDPTPEENVRVGQDIEGNFHVQVRANALAGIGPSTRHKEVWAYLRDGNRVPLPIVTHIVRMSLATDDEAAWSRAVGSTIPDPVFDHADAP